MIETILPIAGVPDELLRVLNERFRQLSGGDGGAGTGTPAGVFFTTNKRPDANGTAIGTFGADTDTGILYQVQTVGSKQMWVQISQASAHVSAVSSANVILTTSYAYITGLRVTLTKKGWWRLDASVNVGLDKNDGSTFLQLMFGGVAQTGPIAMVTSVGSNVIAIQAARHWYVNSTTGAEVCEIQGKKASGSGNSSAGDAGFGGSSNSIISATWLHP